MREKEERERKRERCAVRGRDDGEYETGENQIEKERGGGFSRNPGR